MRMRMTVGCTEGAVRTTKAETPDTANSCGWTVHKDEPGVLSPLAFIAFLITLMLAILR